jgi:hypothetical protein
LEALINYFKNSLEKLDHVNKDGKRERTTTERAKESKEQDLEMSPRKKKKMQKENEKGKKKDEGEFGVTGKKMETNKEGKRKKSGKEETKKKDLNPKAKEKQVKRAESNAELLAAKEILASSLCSQFGNVSERISAVSVNEDTPLTSTWALCNPDLQKHSQLDTPVSDNRPSETPVSGK